MADLQKLFEKFNEKITLTKSKSDSLKTSRDALRSDVKNWFSDKNKKQPKFCWQGSFAMKTVVNPLDGKEYDLDDGVYIQDYENMEMDEWISPSTVHKWVKDAVYERNQQDVIDKDTCVRVPYAAGYHIDLPIYICKDDVAYLAHKNKGWSESDPKAFKDWFVGKVNSEDYGEQLRSIVKYLKAWRDYKGIPLKGIEITILATNSFDKYDERDDKSLRNTVTDIIDVLEKDFKCVKPVIPEEDLFDDASETKKNSILSGLKTLKTNLDKAIDESDEKKASEYVRKSFGDRFPLGEESINSQFATSKKPGVLKHDGRSA
ncbi:cyclic GMP-AMP synthase DncV-like nucleotidyltransferase [Mediterraneibacter gnavus]|uniref:cyclic GMP-AMP synthase DncV-like nucleotidyltransferase n=1 Tax=Mediterraneibacter gnavus TaxID=33038 RepID=UPI0036F43712